MTEHSSSNNKNIRAGIDTFELERMKSKSDQELMDEIDLILSTSSTQDMDTDKIERYLAIIQERSPVMEAYDLSAEWTRLKEDHPMLFQEDPQEPTKEKKPKKKPERPRTVRILRVVEIVCACLLLLMVTANAFGVNPIKAFFQWADEVVQVYTNPSGLMELPEGSESEYRTLEEALSANGAETGNCPNWVPEDCTLDRVYVRTSDSAIKYSAVYTSDMGGFSIRVIQYLDDSACIAERENDGNGYFHGGREYYIVPNYERSSAGWQNGLYSYTISGQISEAELKTMIDSIK